MILRLSAAGIMSVGLLVLGGCAAKDTQGPTVPATPSAPQTSQATPENTSFTGGVKQLLAMGKPQRCEWHSGDERGVVYLDGQRVRTEARDVLVAEGVKGDMVMVSDGTWMYTWNTATKKGQKFKMEDMERMQERFGGAQDMMEEQESEMPAPQDYMTQEHTYTCTKWRVDEQKFAVPKDVTFEDMSAMLEQARKAMQGMASQCDSLPEAQRAACADAMAKFAQ